MIKAKIFLIAALLAVASSSRAQVEIKDEPRATKANSGDLLLISQYDTTKSITLDNLLNGALFGQPRFTKFTITPAMIKAGTPVTILTPPVGYTVEILSTTMYFTPGDTLYDQAPYITLTEVVSGAILGYFDGGGVITSATKWAQIFTNDNYNGTFDPTNQAVGVLFQNTPPTVGNGTVKIYITYIFKQL